MSSEKKSRSKRNVIKAVIAAAIGVQSEQNRAKDFSTKSIIPYILSGIAFTILFMIIVTVIAMTALKMLS